jgi:hypothetical protein
LAVKALQAPASIDSRGVFCVMMAGPRDDYQGQWRGGNTLIRDLLNGSEEFGVPACGVGSILALKYCVPIADGIVSAGKYIVLEPCDNAHLDEFADPAEWFQGDWIRPVGGEHIAGSVEEFVTELCRIV